MNGVPMRHILAWLVMMGAQSLPTGAAFSAESEQRLRFTPDGMGGYAFDTGVLRGTLRRGGKSRGLSSVVHVPTGTRLDRSAGIVSHYRVFTAAKRHGSAAWDWPSTAELEPDGNVRTIWPPAPDRPFEMTALYRWADARTLDVETTVTARKDLSGFESFLASYFDESFPSPYALTDSQGGNVDGSFVLGQKALGNWLMFARGGDAKHLRLIRDGRWTLAPNPVDWTILPRLGAPVCFRRGQSHSLTAILMAPHEDCFAVAMPYEGESHYSLYLSLFGRDFKAGETAVARTRLVVANDASDEQIRRLYRQYTAQTPPTLSLRAQRGNLPYGNRGDCNARHRRPRNDSADSHALNRDKRQEPPERAFAHLVRQGSNDAP